jgi:hypothetical protein
MTFKEIGPAIAAGLAAALVIVILGVLDALPLGVFIAVLVVGGLIGAAGSAYFGDRGAPPPSVEYPSPTSPLGDLLPPPPPEESRPEEDAGGAAAA